MILFRGASYLTSVTRIDVACSFVKSGNICLQEETSSLHPHFIHFMNMTHISTGNSSQQEVFHESYRRACKRWNPANIRNAVIMGQLLRHSTCEGNLNDRQQAQSHDITDCKQISQQMEKYLVLVTNKIKWHR
jgi:hypothetical protein